MSQKYTYTFPFPIYIKLHIPSDMLPCSRPGSHVLIYPNIHWDMLLKDCSCCNLRGNIGIVVVTADKHDLEQIRVFQLPIEMVSYIHMTCMTSNAPAFGQANCTFVIHLKYH